MRGYPKFIATHQDFLNLLAMPEFKKQALAELKKLDAVDDQFVYRVVSGSEETKNLITERIANPNPLWKLKGFPDKAALTKLSVEVAEDPIEGLREVIKNG